MHYSTVVAALFATGAFAAPGHVYQYHYVTEVVTVYGDKPTPAPVVDAVDTKETPCPDPVAEPEVAPAKHQYVWVEQKPQEQPQKQPERYIEEPVQEKPQEQPEREYEQPEQKEDSQSVDLIDGSYEKIATDYHNQRRAEHGAPPLQWDPELASIAREHASSCVYGHSKKYGGGGYGQNIAAGYAAKDIQKLLTAFYNECSAYVGEYGKANPGGSFKSYGHFTQMVWKDTSRLGCATVTCPSLVNASGHKDFTVCNYKSPGNVSGQYGDNVGAPSGQY